MGCNRGSNSFETNPIRYGEAMDVCVVGRGTCGWDATTCPLARESSRDTWQWWGIVCHKQTLEAMVGGAIGRGFFFFFSFFFSFSLSVLLTITFLCFFFLSSKGFVVEQEKKQNTIIRVCLFLKIRRA